MQTKIHKLSIVGLIALASVTVPAVYMKDKVGIDFFMVGDYGYVQNMAPSYLTFNKMNEIINDSSDPRNDIDFMMTMGDNLYPAESEPTDEEFDLMMTLFNDRPNLANKTIYAVRGNHDCYFDINKEIELG